MSKLDDIFDVNTVALTQYTDAHGDKVTDFDTVILKQVEAKRQIKKLILDLFKEANYEPYEFVDKVEKL